MATAKKRTAKAVADAASDAATAAATDAPIAAATDAATEPVKAPSSSPRRVVRKPPARSPHDGTPAAALDDGLTGPAKTSRSSAIARHGPDPSRPPKSAKPLVSTDPAIALAAEADLLDEDFVARIAPLFRRLRTYTRLQVAGLDNVPEKGPAILAANHTGWLGLDYALTVLSVHDGLGRMPRGMAHAAWFANPTIGQYAQKLGLYKADKATMARLLSQGHLIMLFPEGEKGAFRPGSDYTLLPFARGFVRVAMTHQVPIVPVAVLGGEEANPVGARINGYEDLLKIGIPLPTTILPKPVKWRIKFLPPCEMSGYTADDAADVDKVHAFAEDVRTRVQKELRKLKVERGHPYF